MAEQELILECGVELGCATIYRFKCGDGWSFHAGWQSIFLNEKGEEDVHGGAAEPAAELEEAITHMGGPSGGWLFYSPSYIHPEFRKAIWQIVQKTAKELPSASFTRWKEGRYELRWQRACNSP
jgi:hypothetical protein